MIIILREVIMIEKECLNCSEKFKAHLCHIKRGGGKYCSQSCAKKHTRESATKKLEGNPRDRFFSNIKKEEGGIGCWVWTGLASKQGYGRMTIKKRQKLAHRYSWEIHIGEIPDEMFVCHRCDNPTCVNPDHLFVGSRADNVKDMHEKNRNRDDRGSKHPMAKLNEDKVIQIRKKINNGDRQIDLAKEYDVHPMTISNIKNRKKWKHI